MLVPEQSAVLGVLEKGGIGHVGGWKPQGDVRPLGLVLVGALGLDLALPLAEALHLGLVVGAKLSHDSPHGSGQLALPGARRGYQMAQKAAQFLPRVVRIAETDVANVSPKWRKEEGNDGFLHVRRHLRGQ